MIREATLLDVLTVAHRMRPRDWQAIHAIAGNVGADAYACDIFSRKGMTWCLDYDDGHPIGVGGLHDEDDGNATWWMVGTPAIEKFGKTLVRLGRHIVKRSIGSGEFRRLQCYCLADWPQAVRFAERIGLQREGLLRKVGRNGEDMIVMAVVA